MKNDSNAPGASDITARNRALVRKRIASFQRLPTLVTRLLAVMSDPDADTGTIVEDMRFDPGLTANVLKLANSAHFGTPRSVGSLKEAVVRLGIKRLFDLVVATGVGTMLQRPLRGYGLPPARLLQHSAWVAAASEELCSVLGLPQPDLVFTAGILHDVGKIVLSDILEESADAALRMTETGDTGSFEEVEMNIAGMSHAEAGAMVLDRWQFPEELISAVRLHHRPENTDTAGPTAHVIHLSDTLAYAQGVGTGLDGMNYPVSSESVSFLGVTERDVEYVASITLDRMLALQDILSC